MMRSQGGSFVHFSFNEFICFVFCCWLIAFHRLFSTSKSQLHVHSCRISRLKANSLKVEGLGNGSDNV